MFGGKFSGPTAGPFHQVPQYPDKFIGFSSGLSDGG